MLDLDLLRRVPITRVINAFQVGDLPFKASGILPEEDVQGDVAKWDIRGISRDVGTFEGKHSPAGTRKLDVIGQSIATLARTFKSTLIQGSWLTGLRRTGSDDLQPLAEEQIAKAALGLRQVIDRQDEFMIARALQGTLAMTIDGIAHSIDYKIPASHKLSVGAGIPVAWSDPSANIMRDINSFLDLAATDSGRILTNAYCSRKVIEYLISNEATLGFFGSTPAGVQALTEGRIGRFMGINWNVSDQRFVTDPETGATERYLDEKKIVFAPAPDPDWGSFGVGTDVVPEDGDAGMKEVRGLYAYTRGKHNPASIELFAGKVRIPIIRQPSALVVAQVVA